ncbi:hypothetical protein [Winogradskyella sp. Asnod2-B02-A]|uniref:hypothetical protein n=1 Tax=Winogradskyella sp. Asnod2-B02-A TaxID=3160583 RepID=UPI00386F597B
MSYNFYSKMFRTLILIFLLMCLSCSGQYHYDANGKTIELSEDDPFQIVLEGNSGPDFYWEIISKNTYVKLQNPVSIATDADKRVYTFDFKTVSDGEEHIEMIYTDGNTIENTFRLNVIVGTIGLITSDLIQ